MSKTDLFQSIGTLLALVISVSALIVSIQETKILETQQKAMVWPYVEIKQSYSHEGFGLTVTNKGAGPALINDVQVSLGDTYVTDFFELLSLADPDHGYGYHNCSNNSINNTVLMAGEQVMVFFMPYEDKGRELIRKFLPDTKMEIQYCSVLDECWRLDSQKGVPEKGELEIVKQFDN